MARDVDAVTARMHFNGWFHGLNEVLKDNLINKEEYAKLKSYCFRRLAEKLKEAKREVDRLEALFRRLDVVCQQGGVQKPFHGNAAASDPDVDRFRQELKAFHGWTVSLVETDYYFLAVGESPGTARDKFHYLSTQLSDLTILRAALRQEINTQLFVKAW